MSTIRKLLLLPVAAAALLAGCATYGYGYGGGAGDYYYGQPSADYGYYGSYGYGYGYPGYAGYYGYGYAPYWGGSIGYYRDYGPPRHWHGDGHDHGGGHGGHDGHDHGGGQGGHDGHDGHDGGDHTPDRPRPPWRDLGSLARPQPPAGKRFAGAPDVPVQPQPRTIPQRPAPVQQIERIPRAGGWKRDTGRIPQR
jgi:hypothetical protein